MIETALQLPFYRVIEPNKKPPCHLVVAKSDEIAKFDPNPSLGHCPIIKDVIFIRPFIWPKNRVAGLIRLSQPPSI